MLYAITPQEFVNGVVMGHSAVPTVCYILSKVSGSTTRDDSQEWFEPKCNSQVDY